MEKFQAVTALVEAEVEGEVPPQLVGAVTIDDREIPHEELAERVRTLVAADEYVREHPGEPFVNADRPALTAGIIDENEGLVVAPWHTPISYGTGLAIPVRKGVKLSFFSSDRDNFRGPDRNVPVERHLKFITPDTVALDALGVAAVNVRESIIEGGLLVVGREAVGRFFEGLDSRKIEKAVSRTIGGEY